MIDCVHGVRLVTSLYLLSYQIIVIGIVCTNNAVLVNYLSTDCEDWRIESVNKNQKYAAAKKAFVCPSIGCPTMLFFPFWAN